MLRTVLALVVVGSFAGIASAQTGIALRMTPWEDGVQGEVNANALWTFETETDNANADFSIGIYEIDGRVRLDASDPHSPAVGWSYGYFDLNGDDPALPRELVDVSIALGMGVGEYDGWGVEIVAGVGYAGEGHFDDGDAIYGIGSVIVGKRLSEDQALRFFLSYDGNRSILPDFPLPGVAWWHRIDQALQYTVGIPFSSLTWTPAADWTVTFRYTLLLNVELEVAWDVHEQWQLFARFDNRYDERRGDRHGPVRARQGDRAVLSPFVHHVQRRDAVAPRTAQRRSMRDFVAALNGVVCWRVMIRPCLICG